MGASTNLLPKCGVALECSGHRCSTIGQSMEPTTCCPRSKDESSRPDAFLKSDDTLLGFPRNGGHAGRGCGCLPALFHSRCARPVYWHAVTFEQVRHSHFWRTDGKHWWTQDVRWTTLGPPYCCRAVSRARFPLLRNVSNYM